MYTKEEQDNFRKLVILFIGNHLGIVGYVKRRRIEGRFLGLKSKVIRLLFLNHEIPTLKGINLLNKKNLPISSVDPRKKQILN